MHRCSVYDVSRCLILLLPAQNLSAHDLSRRFVPSKPSKTTATAASGSIFNKHGKEFVLLELFIALSVGPGIAESNSMKQ